MLKTESSSPSQRQNLFAQDEDAAKQINAIDSPVQSETVLSKQSESGSFLRRQWRRRRS